MQAASRSHLGITYLVDSGSSARFLGTGQRISFHPSADGHPH
jgi:hypothetical protein